MRGTSSGTGAVVQTSKRWLGRYVGGHMGNIAVVAAFVGLLAAGCGTTTTGTAESRQPESSPSTHSPPTSMRLVGLGHAAIAVPDDWATNAMRCGTPTRDTVVIDVAIVPACGAPRPKGVESVEVTQGKPRFDFTADETFTVDGLRAQRQATTCGADAFGDSHVCAGVVYIPSLRVSFRAESSTSAEEVGRILRRLRIVPDRVAVPGYQTVAATHQERSGDKYVNVLREAGLKAKVRTRRRPSVLAGFVLGAAPQPGTMLRPGTAVNVTVGPERNPR